MEGNLRILKVKRRKAKEEKHVKAFIKHINDIAASFRPNNYPTSYFETKGLYDKRRRND